MINFISIALATWRLSRMLYDLDEDGPFDIFHRIRVKAGVSATDHQFSASTMSGRAITCPYCVSWWVGMLLTVLHFIHPKLGLFVSLPLALSGIVVLMFEHVDPPMNDPSEYPPLRLLD